MQPGGSTENLEKAIQTVSLLVQEKILFKPKDEIGLVLMGTKGKKGAGNYLVAQKFIYRTRNS